jgi:hypothetical protein
MQVRRTAYLKKIYLYDLSICFEFEFTTAFLVAWFNLIFMVRFLESVRTSDIETLVPENPYWYRYKNYVSASKQS